MAHKSSSKNRSRLTLNRLSMDMGLAVLLMMLLVLPVSFIGFFSVKAPTTQVLGETTRYYETSSMDEFTTPQSTQSTSAIQR